MHRTEKQMDVRISENVMGGEGELRFLDILSKEELQGAGRLFSRVTVPPGAKLGLHRHTGEYEIYYFLSGEGMVNDGSSSVPVKGGDVTVCADGERHAMENTGDTDLVFLAAILYTK